MKHALVPVEATDEMKAAGDIPLQDIHLGNGTTTKGIGLWGGPSETHKRVIVASPNGGKVSDAQLNAAQMAIVENDAFPYMPYSRRMKIARAVIEALGLEVEE